MLLVEQTPSRSSDLSTLSGLGFRWPASIQAWSQEDLSEIGSEEMQLSHSLYLSDVCAVTHSLTEQVEMEQDDQLTNF